jgi:hypothetical protein
MKLTNTQFAKTCQSFIAACQRAGVEPTTRQASKFRNKKGSAFAHFAPGR